MTGSFDPEFSEVELGRLLLDRVLSNASGDRLTLAADDGLISEGDDADSVFVLIDGLLSVTKTIKEDQASLAELGLPGTVIGEMVTMGGGKRTATVKAKAHSHLIRMTPDQFNALMTENPELASGLAQNAVRRAEENELAEILVNRFGLTDPNSVSEACGFVTWRTLTPGETLFAAGSKSDAVFFIVRGRLRSDQFESDASDPVTVGVFAKGDVVGELGVLSDTPRLATVTALRRTVVAEMKSSDFITLTESRPRLLIDLALAAVSRLIHSSHLTSPATIIALAAPALERRRIISGLVAELDKEGHVNTLSAEKVDGLLGTPGVANSDSGEVGDVRVSRLVHEFELESDHLILDVGDEDSPWARRALGLGDRILVVSPDRPLKDHAHRVKELLVGCPVGVPRTLVIEHSKTSTPSGTAGLLQLFSCESALHIRPGDAADLARVARVVAGHGTALAIGGGGARGFAHIGAYRALLELGIPVDVVAGTSIGGVLGTAIADDLDPEAILEMAERQFSGVLDYTIPIVSLIKGERIASAAESHFGDRRIEDLRKTYLTVSTDLTTSRPHLHDSGSIVTAIRATSAIPGVMPPVPLDGALLVDGGVLNNLPMDVARSVVPAGLVFAFDVAPPRGPGAHGDYGLAVSGWKALRSRSGGSRSPYPRISAVLMRSMITASMRERDRQVATGLADFYINLDMRGVSMLDFSSPAEVAKRGYEAAMPVLEEWIAGRGPIDRLLQSHNG